MIREAITKILEIAPPTLNTVKDVFGVETTFASAQLHQVKAAAPPLPEPVSVNTLSGLADLIRNELEGHSFVDPTTWALHVEKENLVSLVNLMSDPYGRRQIIAQATPVPFKSFRFDQWIPQEEFVIALASLFEDTPDRAYCLSMAASLTNDASSNSEDDGFTQKVTVKQGLRLKSETTIKPRVTLAPYRTFPELNQPWSEFVFRARIPENGQPLLMLTEADGGKWKVEAISTIHNRLAGMELAIPIIA